MKIELCDARKRGGDEARDVSASSGVQLWETNSENVYQLSITVSRGKDMPRELT